MSWEATAWARKAMKQLGSEVKPVQRLLLVLLGDTADEKGVSWPSVKTLALECGCSARTIRRSLDDLSDRKLLKKVERRALNGRQQSNYYQLNIGLNLDALQGDNLTPPPSTEGDNLAGGRVSDCHGEGVTAVSPLEQPLEPKPLSHCAGAFETFEMNWGWEPAAETVAFALSRSAVPLLVANALANDAELVGNFRNHQLANPGRKYSASGWANRLAMWLLRDWQRMNRPTDEQQYRTARGFDLHPTNAGVPRHAKQPASHVMSPREAAERNGQEFAVPDFARPAPASQPPEYTAGNTYDADDWG